MTIVHNKAGRTTLLYLTANATLNVATVNSTVDSDLSVSGSGEAFNVQGASITKLSWSTGASTPIIIKRGSNTVFQLNGSDHWDLRQMNMVQDLYPAATLVITLPDTNSTIYVEMTKIVGGGVTPNFNDH